MIVGVTGATSTIGEHVVARLAAGHTAVRMGRGGGVDRRFDIGVPLAVDALSGLDAVVHLAWSWEIPADVNARSAIQLAEACAAAGVKPVLISTYSAFASATSAYGAAKLTAEQAVVGAGGVAVRAGLVWGADPSGIVATLMRLARLPLLRLRLVPDTAMHHTSIAELADALVLATTTAATGVYTAAADDTVSLAALLAALRRRRGVPVPVPLGAAFHVVRAGERLRIPLPLRSDSLAALRADIFVAGHADIERVGACLPTAALLAWARRLP